jgi:adenylosuccinate lyase
MRERGQAENDLLARLAADSRLGLEPGALTLGEPRDYTGAAVAQVDEVLGRVDELVKAKPDAAAYSPAPIL